MGEIYDEPTRVDIYIGRHGARPHWRASGILR